MKPTRCGMARRMVAEIETLAKRVRAEVMRATRDTGLTKNFEMARLRKEGLKVVELIEEYVHALRLELMPAPVARRRAKRVKRTA